MQISFIALSATDFGTRRRDRAQHREVAGQDREQNYRSLSGRDFLKPHIHSRQLDDNTWPISGKRAATIFMPLREVADYLRDLLDVSGCVAFAVC